MSVVFTADNHTPASSNQPLDDQNGTENEVPTGSNASDGGLTERPLHDRLLDEWGMAIVNGDIAVGDRLPEPEMNGDASPSRTVTREATRVLESMGLVSVKRKIGATVNPIGRWNMFDPQVIRWRLGGTHRQDALHELFQLRAAVEPIAARLAAANATTTHWATLTEAAINMVSYSNNANGHEYLAADILFHQTLLEASGNHMFARLSDVVASTLRGRTQYELMPQIANQTALNLHVETAALIRKGDGAGAESAIRRIVDESDAAAMQLAAH